MQIVEPTPNAVTGPDFTVKVDLKGGRIVKQTTGELTSDEGHVHLTLDGKGYVMSYGDQAGLPRHRARPALAAGRVRGQGPRPLHQPAPRLRALQRRRLSTAAGDDAVGRVGPARRWRSRPPAARSSSCARNSCARRRTPPPRSSSSSPPCSSSAWPGPSHASTPCPSARPRSWSGSASPRSPSGGSSAAAPHPPPPPRRSSPSTRLAAVAEEAFFRRLVYGALAPSGPADRGHRVRAAVRARPPHGLRRVGAADRPGRGSRARLAAVGHRLVAGARDHARVRQSAGGDLMCVDSPRLVADRRSSSRPRAPAGGGTTTRS